MPRIFTVFLILAAVVFQVDDLFPVSWIPGNMPASLVQPMWAWHEVVWKNMVDRWSLLGFSFTPYFFSSSRKCYGFFISFSTLSAFFSLQYFLEISYFISSDRSSVGNCNCSWHCLNNFLDAGSFSQIDQKLFLFQIQSLLLFQNNVIQYIWHLKWRLFIVLIHDNGAWKSWKQLPFV